MRSYISEEVMTGIKLVMLAAVTGCFAMATAQQAKAQIAVGVEAEPQCPYGYYDAVPYDCAPYGYYGPDWFVGGVFIGSGRWFHGPANFYGHVDNRYDPHHGYAGPMPIRGERPFYHFHGNEGRD